MKRLHPTLAHEALTSRRPSTSPRPPWRMTRLHLPTLRPFPPPHWRTPPHTGASLACVHPRWRIRPPPPTLAPPPPTLDATLAYTRPSLAQLGTSAPHGLSPCTLPVCLAHPVQPVEPGLFPCRRRFFWTPQLTVGLSNRFAGSPMGSLCGARPHLCGQNGVVKRGMVKPPQAEGGEGGGAVEPVPVPVAEHVAPLFRPNSLRA